MNTPRVRIVQYVVQPTVVVDDGETLTPLQVQPLIIPAGKWGEFVEHGLAAALAQLQAEVENNTPDDA